MKTILTSLSVLLLATAFTSCDNDNGNENPTTEQTLTNFFNVCTNTQTGEKSIIEDVNYIVKYEYGTKTADIRISGQSLPDGTTYPMLTLEPLSWENGKDGWRTIDVPMVTTSATNFGNAPVLNDFEFDIKDCWNENNQYTAMTHIGYRLNQYKIVSIPESLPVFATTKVSNDKSSNDFETNSTVYLLEFNPTDNTANIVINNFLLFDDLSSGYLAIHDLALSISDDGDITIKGDNATGTTLGSNNSDTQKLPVKDVYLTLDGDDFNLTYKITVDDITYTVVAE